MSGGTVGAGTGLGLAVLRLLLAVVVLVGTVLLVAGWYFADELTEAPPVRPFVADTTVVDADEDTITLTTTDDLRTGGAFGLQLPNDGYAELGGRTEDGGATVTYAVRSYADRVPRPGTVARVDEYWRVGTPDDVGLAHEDVTTEGPLGEMVGWWVPGGDRGTVVYVHGRGATREEALRFLPALTAQGWNVLVATYRGDEGAPPRRDGRLRFGTEEWVDVDAWVRWVQDRIGDEEPLVLFGTSMGGAVVGQFLDRSPVADDVDGVVLDSPVLSLDRTMELQADLAGVPAFAHPALVPTAELWADLLHGVDTSALEQTAADGTFDVPTLVFHGAEDDFVPWEPSLALAANAPTVEHVAIPGAGHARSWNVDRSAYEARLAELLDDVS